MVRVVQDKGTCFVISPIGDDESETRRRADQVFKHIIEPVAKEFGFRAVRADHISKPGIITSQIISHLVEDPLVIADLAGHNPNVFYELAIRHVARKPVIQLTQVGERIPFDIAPTRAIQLDHKDMDSVALCKQNLERQIRSVETDTSDFDNPVSTAIDLKLLRQSDSPSGKSNARVISMLSDLRAMMAQLLASSTQRSEMASQRFKLSLPDDAYQGLLNEATRRGITVQELVRAVVLPDWMEKAEEAEMDAEAQAKADADAQAAEAEAEAEATEADLAAEAQAEAMPQSGEE